VCASLAVAACCVAPAAARAQSYLPPQTIQDRCVTCHLPFKNEDVAATHFKAARPPAFEAGDITCERCHGTNNDEHRADEDGLTAPEKMFARDKIAAMCSVAECHPKHSDTVSAEDLKKQVCTDCHGSHRMKVRIRIWDKETGKLLEWK
jgi:formate-dependent nitrite reductase cytochrome c552 subunit